MKYLLTTFLLLIGSLFSNEIGTEWSLSFKDETLEYEKYKLRKYYISGNLHSEEVKTNRLIDESKLDKCSFNALIYYNPSTRRSNVAFFHSKPPYNSARGIGMNRTSGHLLSIKFDEPGEYFAVFREASRSRKEEKVLKVISFVAYKDKPTILGPIYLKRPSTELTNK